MMEGLPSVEVIPMQVKIDDTNILMAPEGI